MKGVDIRRKIRDLILTIKPLDNIEKQHIDFAVDWVDSGAEIFLLKSLRHTQPIWYLTF